MGYITEHENHDTDFSQETPPEPSTPVDEPVSIQPGILENGEDMNLVHNNG